MANVPDLVQKPLPVRHQMNHQNHQPNNVTKVDQDHLLPPRTSRGRVSDIFSSK
ncbi:hypothetical protein VFPPC_16035 [Pochonia chlamydosporia 170]|uniref:Uncharacterized protein n=1 Tax=Pochonia chlamydosporia 170 TaxID=1380566 RepID=A0A179FMU4_METCM|nr:hypothetical protein VFPPC_16035 [Pochonia chlamydosporia 170]OAQ66481.1 hypothetical protein VFPPC_16035 [Pochonia chlamydosporia 170]